MRPAPGKAGCTAREVRIDLSMETAFARWLRERGESHSAYAIRNRMGKKQIARLAGVAREAKPIVRFYTYGALCEISKDTGIPIQVLIDDAVEAAHNPIEPRKYVKKGMDDGKTTVAAE
jgi:hypothetical protein